MTVDEFWNLISLVDHSALDDGDEDGAVAPLVTALASSEPAQILGFDDRLAEVLYGLDTRAHCDASGASSDSGDAFLYARCYVVVRGRAHYENALAHPEAMPQTLEEWCEALLTVAAEAWHGEWNHQSPLSYETGSNTLAWK